MRSTRLILIGFILLVASAYALALVFFPRLLPQPAEIVAFLRQMGPIAPILFVLICVGRGIILFPPSVTLSIISGIVFGPVWGAIYAHVGSFSCASVQFGLAKRYGRPFVDRIVGGHRKLPDVTPLTTVSSIILLRLVMIGVPFDLVNFGLGLTQTIWRNYLLGTALGLIPGIILATQFAHALDESFSPQIFAVTALITAVATGFLAYRYRRYRRVQRLHPDP